MEHDGHRDRLRRRYQAEGLGGFAAHEILELLLTYAIPRVDVNPIAHRLIEHFGSLHGVMEASVEELTHVEGIGEKTAVFLTMLLPVFRAYEMEKRQPKLCLKNYGELIQYCRALFVGARNEQLYLLCFDAQMQLQAARLIATGTPAEVSVIPRQMMQVLIRYNSVSAVMVHNHPSGSARPSAYDMELTAMLERALSGVGIRLNDHIIIAGEAEYSFFLNGMLQKEAAGPRAFLDSEEKMAADRPGPFLSLDKEG